MTVRKATKRQRDKRNKRMKNPFVKGFRSDKKDYGKIGTALKSIGSFLLGGVVLIGLILLVLFFVKGGVWLGEKILPWLLFLMWPVLAIGILIFLPMGIFKRTKGAAALGLGISSYVFGLTLWFWGLILTYLIWGMAAVFIGLFIAGIGAVPLSILATALEGEWSTLGQLIFLLFLTFGSAALGSHFAARADELAAEKANKRYRNTLEKLGEKEEKKQQKRKNRPEISKQVLGIAYHNKGMYDEAIVEYKKVVEINPEYSVAYYNLGLAYFYGKKMYDKAIAAYEKAIEINPEYSDAYYVLGIAYSYGKKMYDKAIVEYKKAVEINPGFARAHHGLGTTYYRKREYRLAIGHYDKAIELGCSVDPNILQFLEPYREK